MAAVPAPDAAPEATPTPRKRMDTPLAERPPRAPRDRVAPAVAEGMTVKTVSPRTLAVRAPKVSVAAAVAAEALMTSSPPCSKSGRLPPRRLEVAAPSTTVSLPLLRRVIAPVPPKVTPLTFTLPARMSIVPIIAVLVALKLTVPAP